jgi:predicted nucleic acid-binding protein
MQTTWVDTNILLRLITKSPSPMYDAARAYLEALERSPSPQALVIHPAHICEAIFVLEGKIYTMTPAQAAHDLRKVLSLAVFEVVDEAAVVNALIAYPQSKLDYPDVLLCELARQRGASVLTFERKLARLGVPVIVPGEQAGV